jgi:hypothetical protein
MRRGLSVSARHILSSAYIAKNRPNFFRLFRTNFIPDFASNFAMPWYTLEDYSIFAFFNTTGYQSAQTTPDFASNFAATWDISRKTIHFRVIFFRRH